jgi:hypothetical protein
MCKIELHTADIGSLAWGEGVCTRQGSHRLLERVWGSGKSPLPQNLGLDKQTRCHGRCHTVLKIVCVGVEMDVAWTTPKLNLFRLAIWWLSEPPLSSLGYCSAQLLMQMPKQTKISVEIAASIHEKQFILRTVSFRIRSPLKILEAFEWNRVSNESTNFSNFVIHLNRMQENITVPLFLKTIISIILQNVYYKLDWSTYYACFCVIRYVFCPSGWIL